MDGQTLNPLEDLPPELSINILRFLDLKSLLAACRVNKSWMRMISCVSEVWIAACEGLGLLLADYVKWRMCRDIYVRLAQRWQSVVKQYSFVIRYFHGYYPDSVTAIYYHDGKVAIGFETGAMSLWDCATVSWVWVNTHDTVHGTPIRYSVTSIKFDDRILLASYCNGTVMSRDVRTGNPVMTYHNPCIYTRTVDYLSEANLVFSSESLLVAWNMANGRLVLAETLNTLNASKMLVAPYPGEEGAKKLLVAVREEFYLVLWQAISGLDSFGEMAVSVRITRTIHANCPNGSRCSFPFGNDLHFDGRLLCFVTHELDTCNGYLNQWDVGGSCWANAKRLTYPVKKLLGVGKKYLLIIAATVGGEEQMNIVEKGSLKSLTRVQLCKEYQYNPQRLEDLFCIGRRSWLDGFDGSNDQGEIFFYVAQPNCVNYFEWHDRQATGYGNN